MSIILMLSLAALLCGAALAQPAQDNRRPGYLARFDERFRAADKDGDGALSKGEAGDANFGRLIEHFERLDANGDGKVSREEMRGLIRGRFSS